MPMLIGEAPGEEEDLLGYPFVGKAGKILTEVISSFGLSRFAFFITNAVHCRPVNNGKNRTPTPQEIRTCNDWLQEEIKFVKPSAILLLGNTAIRSVLQHSQSISSLRGKIVLWQDIPIMATYHPAAIIYNPSLEKFFYKDIKNFCEMTY